MADLFDDDRPAGSRWTRVNIGEAIPGVPTPLSWSIWKPAMEHAFWWAQLQLGVASRAEYGRAPVTTLALGRPAISVDLTVEQVGRLPGYDPDAFAEQYFGLARTEAPAPAARSARVLGRVAMRAPIALGTLGRRVSTTSSVSQAAWNVVFGAPPHDPVALLQQAADRFKKAMAVHTLQGIVCQGAYERAAALGGTLAPRLVSADGDLAEARLASDLWDVSRGRLRLDELVSRHGFHGPYEGELSSASWREDPSPVKAAVASLETATEQRAPKVGAAARTADRLAAQEQLLAGLPRWRRPAARVLLRSAMRLVAQRELGKAAFLRHLDVARFAARAIAEDAMWCTLDELRTGQHPSDADIECRRARRDELQSIELPLSWVGDPTPQLPATPDDSTVVRGLGVSPGVVSGRARVVTDPARYAEVIGPDDVLVARTTDPSWVTLFVNAAALVIDVGGALSHGAIVARELGIPCVIGTGDGTARIADGTPVRVNGDTGEVELWSEPLSQPEP